MNETVAQPQPDVRTSTRPRLGFAGLGWIGRHRLEAIAESGAGEIAVIFEPDSQAAGTVMRLAPQAEQADTFDALLAGGVDGVVIATPNVFHASQAIAALEAGKAVFCQKPLGRDARETRRVIDAARAANRLLHVDLSYRFTNAMQQIRGLIRSGALGRIYAIEAMFHNAYGPAKAWFYDREQAGGGCLLDLGIHLIDLALWSLDFPAVTRVGGQVLRRSSQETGSRPVEDYASAHLLLDDSVSVQLACSWHAPAGCDARIGMTFFGQEGGAGFSNINGSFYDFLAERFLPDRTGQILASVPDAWGGRAAVAWCQRLELSEEFDPEIENLNRVAETIDRIYASAS